MLYVALRWSGLIACVGGWIRLSYRLGQTYGSVVGWSIGTLPATLSAFGVLIREFRGVQYPSTILYKEMHSSRPKALEQLQDGDIYDVIVIGGGSTGAGCALDAATRGLKVALIERHDFASGTSSRSSKLLHGGIRYLAPAIAKLELSQWKLVTESLFERELLVRVIMPHLTRPCGILLPFTSIFKAFEYSIGVILVRIIAGPSVLPAVRVLLPSSVRSLFSVAGPLRGGVMMQDATQDDARANLMIALTASAHGATVVNHVSVTELVKEKGKVCGVVVRDEETGKSWSVHASVVINATGPFADVIREMDEPETDRLIEPSAGSHIVLPPRCVLPESGVGWRNVAGRVAFMIPWQGVALLGTTDRHMDISSTPRVPEEDVQYLLGEAKRIFQDDKGQPLFQRSDILAAWCGIRPLGRPTALGGLEAISRGEVWDVSDSGLLTVSGGKWTTYRAMAETTLDRAIALGELHPLSPSRTKCTQLIGGGGGWEWKNVELRTQRAVALAKEMEWEQDIAQHLVDSYGSQLDMLMKHAQPDSWRRLHPDYPFVVEDVRQGIREMACTTIDILARRMRLAFIHHEAAVAIVEDIVDIMSAELGWDKARQQAEREATREFLQGTDPNHTV